jgi:mannose-6-phosphate isomerase
VEPSVSYPIPPRATAPKRITVKKPWGGFDELTENETTTVKILTVLPHQETSLQVHEHRSEWWVVLDEKMDVVIDDKHMTVYRGQDIFIPQGSAHRVVGLDTPCRWLEISFGDFNERDIHRLKDDYGRSG